jgi:hypothetical protein
MWHRVGMNTRDTQGLQFDKAEGVAAGAPQCNVCKQAIADAYYQVNGKVLCSGCRTQIERIFGGGLTGARLLKATAFGIVAGALGAGIWYAILTFANMELGIIAIAVGFMVGWAVRRGAEYRGGIVFQLLAVLLTYLAIVSTYVPLLVRGVTSPQASEKSVQAAGETGQPAAPVAREKPSARHLSPVAWIYIFGIAIALPFLQGFQNILGIFIIGIALYEAWMLNRKPRLSVGGPFAIGGAAPPAVSS